MTALLFAKGGLIGLAIAAPLGPIGALCISRTLERGFWAGVAGGLGTATADAFYAALAAGGFAAFAALLARLSMPLAIGGGLFMLWLGARILMARPAETAAVAGGGDLAKTVAATFLLTVTNPTTILSFAAIFAGLGLAAMPAAGGAAVAVVAGVFMGSMAWWILLSGGVALARTRLPAAFALWVGRGSGALIVAMGLAAIIAAFWGAA